MSINYHRLNLVQAPLAKNDLSPYLQNEYNFISDVDTFLSPALLEQFKEIGLTPSVAIVFSLGYSSRSESDSSRFIHSDLTWHNNKWSSVPFGVNWELNSDISSTVSWYDITGCICHTPPDDPVYPWTQLNGLFYQGHAKIVEQAVIDSESDLSPILFNTSVPHAVSFITTAPYRCGLSVRFSLDDVFTWTQALDKFQRFIKE